MTIINLPLWATEDKVFYVHPYTAEIISWIDENTSGCNTLPPEPSESEQNRVFIEFRTIEDAVAFKLRWS